MNSELWGAVAGGVAGGLFAVLAVLVQGWVTQHQQTRNENRVIAGVLQAIQDEVDTFWNRYMQTVGGQMASFSPTAPFQVLYPSTFDIFSIYNGSAILIGRIENVNLRRLIVQAYTQFKALADSYRLNNSLLERLRVNTLLAEGALKEQYEPQRQSDYNTLIQYAHVLKASHDRLQALIDALLPTLSAEIRELS